MKIIIRLPKTGSLENRKPSFSASRTRKYYTATNSLQNETSPSSLRRFFAEIQQSYGRPKSGFFNGKKATFGPFVRLLYFGEKTS